MSTPNDPSASSPSPAAVSSTAELPLQSIANLAKATGIALAIAIVLLVFVVLPAEYNIDATGFGEAIGLTRLSAAESTDGAAPVVSSTGASDAREDSVVIEVPAGKSLEYKFSIRAGDKMKYSWKVEPSGFGVTADVDALFFDFHGEPTGGKKGFFESYSVSTASKNRGTLTAPFDGSHGWYWKNKGATLAKVTLVTSGSYEVLGLR
jgi:hypothetical protein